MAGLKQADERDYVTVLGSDGSLRQKVSKETKGAVHREYETSDGGKGEKWELVYKEIEGKIKDINFWEGDFGKTIQVLIEWDGGSATLSLALNTNFGEDFLKKLPAIDLDKPVRIRPYAFEGDNGKPVKGVAVTQPSKAGKGDWDKVQNFFYDKEKGASVHGYPQPQGDTKKFDSDDWKAFYIQARKFMVGYAEQNVLPKVSGYSSPEDKDDWGSEAGEAVSQAQAVPAGSDDSDIPF